MFNGIALAGNNRLKVGSRFQSMLRASDDDVLHESGSFTQSRLPNRTNFHTN